MNRIGAFLIFLGLSIIGFAAYSESVIIFFAGWGSLAITLVWVAFTPSIEFDDPRPVVDVITRKPRLVIPVRQDTEVQGGQESRPYVSLAIQKAQKTKVVGSTSRVIRTGR